MADIQKLNLRPPKTDRLITGLIAAAGDVLPSDWRLDVTTNVPGLGVSKATATPANLPNHEQVSKLMAFAAGHAFVDCVTVSLSTNAIPGAPTRIAYSCAGVSSTIDVSSPSPEHAVVLVEAIAKRFPLTSYQDIIGGVGLAEAEKTALQMRERSVADLAAQLERMAAFLTDLATKEADHRRAQETALEQAHRVRMAALDEQQQLRTNEFEALRRKRTDELEAFRRQMEADIQDREKRLNERQQEFETRQSMYVRRDLLEKMRAILDSNFRELRLSLSTTRKRWAVHVGTWGMLAAAAALFVFGATRFLSQGGRDWRTVPLVIGGSLTFFATLVYYLKWNDRWFREHADAELAARNYTTDMLRASWLAELVSEWRQQHQADPPAEFLAACSRNLFNGNSARGESEHPLDTVGALLRGARQVNIGKDGISLTRAEEKP